MTLETVFGGDELAKISAESREVLRRYHDAFRSHSPEQLVELVADDCYIENIAPAPNGSRHVGKAACLEVWQGLAADEGKRFEHEEIEVFLVSRPIGVALDRIGRLTHPQLIATIPLPVLAAEHRQYQ
jgi:hypothetical protein